MILVEAPWRHCSGETVPLYRFSAIRLQIWLPCASAPRRFQDGIGSPITENWYYLGFFEVVHNVRRQGKALLGNRLETVLAGRFRTQIETSIFYSCL